MAADTMEKRRFSRIPFDATVVIIREQQRWDSHLLDISLKGALVEKPADWSGNSGDTLRLEITLGGEITITMEATVSHIGDESIGLRCDHIDLESISHLRRIVELNTGNEDLLHRELSALSSS